MHTQHKKTTDALSNIFRIVDKFSGNCDYYAWGKSTNTFPSSSLLPHLLDKLIAIPQVTRDSHPNPAARGWNTGIRGFHRHSSGPYALAKKTKRTNKDNTNPTENWCLPSPLLSEEPPWWAPWGSVLPPQNHRAPVGNLLNSTSQLSWRLCVQRPLAQDIRCPLTAAADTAQQQRRNATVCLWASQILPDSKGTARLQNFGSTPGSGKQFPLADTCSCLFSLSQTLSHSYTAFSPYRSPIFYLRQVRLFIPSAPQWVPAATQHCLTAPNGEGRPHHPTVLSKLPDHSLNPPPENFLLQSWNFRSKQSHCSRPCCPRPAAGAFRGGSDACRAPARARSAGGRTARWDPSLLRCNSDFSESRRTAGQSNTTCFSNLIH